MKQATRDKRFAPYITSKKLCRGFTLIELLISLGLFSIVVSIAVGGFVHALRTQRQAQLFLAANSNASASLEIIAREIRTGSNFSQANSSSLAFKNARGKTVTYQLGAASTIERNEGNGFQPITGNNVVVSNLSFLLQGTRKSDGYPPRVTVAFAVSPRSNDPAVSESKVNLATTVSARLADDQPATLVLHKSVVNTSAAGTAHATEFELVVRGNSVRPCKVVTLEDDPSGRFANDPKGTWCKFGGAAHDKDYPENNSTKYFIYMAEGEYEADELPRSGYEKQIFEIGGEEARQVGTGSFPLLIPSLTVGCGGNGKEIEVNDVKNCVVQNTATTPNP